jgi:hypothetical protein
MAEDWRSDDAYSYLSKLASKAVAWEFMRRNADLRVAWPNLRADHALVAWLFTETL